MAHAEENPAEVAKLKGISKIFNSVTIRGRANVAMATYAGVGLIIAYFALKPKKPKAPAQ